MGVIFTYSVQTVDFNDGVPLHSLAGPPWKPLAGTTFPFYLAQLHICVLLQFRNEVDNWNNIVPINEGIILIN